MNTLSFNEIFMDSTRYGTKLPSSEYLEIGKNIIVDQGKEEIAGYTDLNDGIYTDVPAIVFGDHTRIIKYIDKPFFLGADGTKILKSKLNNSNYKYLYYALKNAYIPDTGYNRHFKWLKEVNIRIVDEKEQNRIASELDKINDIIVKQNSKMKLLDELVKARFVEMFDKYEKNISFDKVITDNTKKGYKFDSSNYKKEGAVSIVDQGKELICGYKEKEIDKEPWSEECIIFGDHTEIFKYINFPIYLGADGTKILSISKSWNTRYVYYYLLLNYHHYGGYSRHFKYLKELFFSKPPIQLQEEFALFVQQIDKSKFIIQKQLDETQKLFDKLMQDYFG